MRGGRSFSNGIHLNVIEAAADPADEAWHNIKAINEVCREIISCTRQLVIASFAGNAGAGGVMLGLGADGGRCPGRAWCSTRYYDMGLYGSELHTYTLPRRVGGALAQRLLTEKLPVGAEQAASMGLVDEVGPRHPDAYGAWLTELAQRYADPKGAHARRAAKARRLGAERLPLDVYETRELAEMSRDMFEDRSGFAAARSSFVGKVRPSATPARLSFPVAPEQGRPRQIARPRHGTAAQAALVVRPAVPLPA